MEQVGLSMRCLFPIWCGMYCNVGVQNDMTIIIRVELDVDNNWVIVNWNLLAFNSIENWTDDIDINGNCNNIRDIDIDMKEIDNIQM